ncbi:MAG: c-type cytochrome [Terriglobales bacterium]
MTRASHGWGGILVVAVRIVGVVVIGAALCGISAAQSAEQLYTEKCGNCHATDGSGHTAAANKMAVPDLRSKRIKQMSDEELFSATAEGTKHRSYPHAFLHTGMKEQQIRDLIKYIRTFGTNQN